MVKNYVHLTFIILSNVFVTKNSLTIFLLNDLRNFAGSFLKKSHERKTKSIEIWENFSENVFTSFSSLVQESVFPFVFECPVVLIRRIHLGCKLIYHLSVAVLIFPQSSSSKSQFLFEKKFQNCERHAGQHKRKFFNGIKKYVTIKKSVTCYIKMFYL